MLGLSESGLRKIIAGLGNAGKAASEETVGKSTRFFLPDWLRAWARYSVGGVLNEDGELDSPDSDSPWLEEKRKWSAKRERARYETEIGQLVPLPKLRQGFAVVGGHLRRACELLCQSCHQTIDSALAEASEEMERIFPGDDTDFDDDSESIDGS